MFKSLQNGSDIRGVAIAHQDEKVTLTNDAIFYIAHSFVQWLQNKIKTTKNNNHFVISVGHDPRITADQVKSAVIDGLLSHNHHHHHNVDNNNNNNNHNLKVTVLDFGLASTPAMFMSTVTSDDDDKNASDGAIMITASHLPFNRNGLKFFTAEGGLENNDISDILKRADSVATAAIVKPNQHNNSDNDNDKNNHVKKVDFMKIYQNILIEKVQKGTGLIKPLESFKIIVDAGNGAGGFFEKVLTALGANTEGSQFLEPDGRFPNHIPNPEDETAMKSIRDKVLQTKADLGIIFDTDVDRSAVVDANGMEINKDRLIALLSAIVLEEHPHSTIVTDSVTSNGLSQFIKSKGGIHHRFKRGYKNVINEGIRLNNLQSTECHLAIETSGHGAMKENYFLDDGCYLVVKILIKFVALKKDISSLLHGLIEPLEDHELRLKIKDEEFAKYGQKVIDHIQESVKSHPDWTLVQPNFEGTRISVGGKAWFLIRLSLHDPVLPLNIQSDVEGGSFEIVSAIKELLIGFDKLDVSALTQFIAKNRQH